MTDAANAAFGPRNSLEWNLQVQVKRADLIRCDLQAQKFLPFAKDQGSIL
jgi:hypothetical protein